MPAVSFVNFSFSYPDAARPALENLTLSLRRGEFVLVCGLSGSGKTTLLRCCKPELAPAGQRKGELRLPTAGSPAGRSDAGTIAYVAQDPDNQIVMDSVWHELAFGLENLGLPAPVIRRRMAEIAAFFGMDAWMQQKTDLLSGGQKQMLNLASSLVLQPSLLLLDEPTAQLDPIAAKSFLQAVERVNRELGVTVVLSEHRLEETLPIADRVLLLQAGRLLCDAPPAAFAREVYTRCPDFAAALPAPARAALLLQHAGVPAPDDRLPLDVREGRRFLRALLPAPASIPADDQAAPAPAFSDAETAPAGKAPAVSRENVLLSAHDLWFRYDKDAPFVLRGASLSVRRGEVHAILGGNGGGKTTLLHLLCGALRPGRGRIRREKDCRLGLLSQSPKALLTCDSVLDELRECREIGQYGDGEIHEMLLRFGLGGLETRHPYDLSGGEQQKLALAKLLLLDPALLLLDEPTKGMDAPAKQALAEDFRRLQAEGKTLVLVTHDVEFAARAADRCSLLFDGGVVCTEARRSFFSTNLFYTTETSRMTRGLLSGILLPEELPAALQAARPAQ